MCAERGKVEEPGGHMPWPTGQGKSLSGHYRARVGSGAQVLLLLALGKRGLVSKRRSKDRMRDLWSGGRFGQHPKNGAHGIDCHDEKGETKRAAMPRVIDKEGPGGHHPRPGGHYRGAHALGFCKDEHSE